EKETLLGHLGQLYALGHPVDFSKLYPTSARKLALPSYSWQRERFWIEELPGAAAATAHPAAWRLSDELAECLYEAKWIEKEPVSSAPAEGGSQPGRWLIFCDRGGVGEALAARLEAEGHTCVRVSYELRPDSAEGMDRLVREVFHGGANFRGVVHLGSLDVASEAGASSEWLSTARTLGCQSVLLLIQALMKAGLRDSPRLWLVTRGAQESGASLAQAPLWGLARSVTYEAPELRCTCVDLSSEGGPGDMGLLVSELARNEDEEQLSFRGGRRYVARLVPDTGATRLRASRLTIASNATYWITGGFGGVGLHAARWLVARGARHLVLLGRSGASASSEPVLAELRAAGAEVRALRADVSQQEQLTAATAEVLRDMPPLRGIIHAAGVMDDVALSQLTPEQLHRVMEPKLEGTWNLHRVSQGQPLDFFILCSSVASTLGSPGAASYAAANAFLDAFAHFRRRQGLPAVSINFGSWHQVGMAGQSRREERLAARGLGSLTPEESLEVLEWLASTRVAQRIVMRLDPRQWKEFFLSAATSSFLAELGARRTGSEVVKRHEGTFKKELFQREPGERQGLLEKHVQEQLARVLKAPVSRVGLQTPVMQLGVDSLMAMELRNRLEASLELSLQATLVFRYPTVSGLAGYLAERLGLLAQDTQGLAVALPPSVQAAPSPSPSAPVADPLSSLEAIEQLSEEEILRLFAEKTGG
ncbi:beta-ketoacyl reductase, partial [Hyalangium sp.]|uniref:beta-ketoacyl reductase n=1 Tax=Hyalangium sp. TaxID=2028555 RepID=UPI002D3628CD